MKRSVRLAAWGDAPAAGTGTKKTISGIGRRERFCISTGEFICCFVNCTFGEKTGHLDRECRKRSSQLITNRMSSLEHLLRVALVCEKTSSAPIDA